MQEKRMQTNIHRIIVNNLVFRRFQNPNIEERFLNFVWIWQWEVKWTDNNTDLAVTSADIPQRIWFWKTRALRGWEDRTFPTNFAFEQWTNELNTKQRTVNIVASLIRLLRVALIYNKFLIRTHFIEYHVVALNRWMCSTHTLQTKTTQST